MTIFLWVLIVLALAVGVAVVAWTQHAIWRRLDRIEAEAMEDLIETEGEIMRLRRQTIVALSARTDLTEGGVHPSAFFARKDPS